MSVITSTRVSEDLRGRWSCCPCRASADRQGRLRTISSARRRWRDLKPFVRDLMSPQVLSSDFMKVLSTKGHYVSNIRVIDKKNRYKRKSQIESSDSDEWFLVTLFCMEFFSPIDFIHWKVSLFQTIHGSVHSPDAIINAGGSFFSIVKNGLTLSLEFLLP